MKRSTRSSVWPVLLALGLIAVSCGDDSSSSGVPSGAGAGGAGPEDAGGRPGAGRAGGDDTGGEAGAGAETTGGAGSGAGGQAGEAQGGAGAPPDRAGSGGLPVVGGEAGEPAGGGNAGASGGAGGESPGSGGVSGDSGVGGAGGDAGSEATGPNIVFTTSSQWAPEALGGLDGADAKCQSLADAAGLTGTFVAWLSDSTADARDRLSDARGWVRTDGKPFADRVQDIVAGLHYYTPNHDEHGERVTGALLPVVTGTAPDGTASAPFGDFCQDYTGPNDTYGAVRGDLNYVDDRWTTLGEFVGDLEPCGALARLYCFQIDHDDVVDATFPPSRKAFISSSAVRPDMGRSNLDAECVTEAEANDLTGSFLAFVSTNTESAASRFDLTGLTYARVDGLPIVEQATDLAAGTPLDVPINLHADGNLISGPNQIAYSGADTPMQTSTNATSCNNWSISVYDNFVQVGNPGVSSAAWWNDRTDWRCNTWVKVYCFEE